MPKIVGFWGPHQKNGFMSQWYKSYFTVGGVTYCCCEQYMMAKKAELFGDTATQEKIMNTEDPKKMQQLGRRAKGFDEETWEKKRFFIVCDGNYAKFTQDERLKSMLLATGKNILAEASPYDKIWGIRLRVTDPDFNKPAKWRGANLLGEALMRVRNKIREDVKKEGEEKSGGAGGAGF